MGITFAIFNWSGNIPLVIDWFIIRVRHSDISFAMYFNVTVLRLSCPQLCEGFKLDRYRIVVALSINLKLKVDTVWVVR